jgi:hypothetical protein
VHGMAAAPPALLNSPTTVARASSVLKRNVKLYSPSYVFDGRDDTCWNSDAGSPQYLECEFEVAVDIDHIGVVFQGGFVGQECEAHVSSSAEDPLRYIAAFEPEDVNGEQIFSVSANRVQKLRLIFNKSTDFYGRVTVYHLNVYGHP